jgi:hypothetical protein
MTCFFHLKAHADIAASNNKSYYNKIQLLLMCSACEAYHQG